MPMDSPDCPSVNRDIKGRLVAVDGILKQLRLDLDQTLELIAQLRDHCAQVKSKLGDAERKHALLLRKAEGL